MATADLEELDHFGISGVDHILFLLLLQSFGFPGVGEHCGDGAATRDGGAGAATTHHGGAGTNAAAATGVLRARGRVLRDIDKSLEDGVVPVAIPGFVTGLERPGFLVTITITFSMIPSAFFQQGVLEVSFGRSRPARGQLAALENDQLVVGDLEEI